MFFTRGEIKNYAKATLKNNYGLSVGTNLVVTILNNIFTYLMGYVMGAFLFSTFSGIFSSVFGSLGYSFLPSMFRGVSTLVGVIFLVIAIILSLFVINVLSVGYIRFNIIISRFTGGNIGIIFEPFRTSGYLNIVKVLTVVSLISLACVFVPLLLMVISPFFILLMIPGSIFSIYISLRFFLVSYILAENPNISLSDVLDLSTNMINGFKGELFVLMLSFFGWGILYVLGQAFLQNMIPNSFIVSVLYIVATSLFLGPYTNLTYAEFYYKLKERAINSGMPNAHLLG